MGEFFQHLFSSEFMPHGHCYFWNPGILWLNVVSDAVISFSYYSIPLALCAFIRRKKDLVFDWIFVLFAIFILACGTTHIMEIWNIWHGTYWISGGVKLITAVASLITAILIWPLIPKALALPSPKELERKIDEATKELQEALEERKVLLERERAAREEAERANHMKDEFLATLSHELRTPLNAMFGWVHLLKRGNLDPAKANDGIEVLDRNVRLQSKIIEDLLDMSRIVSGQIRLDIQSVKLGAVLDETIESIRPSVEAKNLHLIKTFDPHMEPIHGDPNRLRQIIWNLLSNAVKFTPREGNIQVTLKKIHSQIEFSVTDNGQGIQSEFLPYVFDKFRQENASTSRRHGGLGIGLSIAKQLVEVHGGTIAVKSEGQGKGATFTVYLPIVALHQSSEESLVHESIETRERSFSPSTPPASRGTLQEKTIVVIDDEPEALALAKQFLEEYGATVYTTSSALDGIDLIKALNPDLVISDIGMPDHDGYDFIRMLRGLPPEKGGTIPAIALTAFARTEDRTRILLAGYQTHLSKPTDPDELIAVVCSIVRFPGSNSSSISDL